MQPIAWERSAELPRGPAAVLAALRLTAPSVELLAALGAEDWRSTLAFCDRTQLTFVVGRICRAHLPRDVGARIDADRARNAARDERLQAAFGEIADRLDERGVEYLLLKGLTHRRVLAPDAAERLQYDIDLYAPPQSMDAARSAILSLGYEPLSQLRNLPTDHLPVMTRKTGWQWRGDYFDPNIPPLVDLHFRFWDESTERLALPGLERFWERRIPQRLDGRSVPVLDPADLFGYACLHLLRHLLRGSLRAYHVYELACLVDQRSGDDAFWDTWRRLHAPDLRQAELISVWLARRWFGGRAPAILEEEEPAEDVRLWMERRAAAPMNALFRPNKSELWLHLPLLASPRDKCAVLRRRLLPLSLPGPVDSVHIPDWEMTPRRKLRKAMRYWWFVASRAAHHARTLAPALVEGLLWSVRGRPFPLFLLGTNLYNLGAFIFFLLYNLYLLDSGFGEGSLGMLAGAMTLGTIAGSLPAAAVARRLGLRRTLLFSCFAGACLWALRVLATSPAALALSAFANGVAFSFWIVSLPPAVSHLTSATKRDRGFSLWLGSGIATGVLGGVIGSRLPGWFAAAGAGSPAQSKQLSILAGCGVALLALWPLARLRLPPAPPVEARVYPRGFFVRRYLLAFALWQLALGGFSPLFNAYFSRRLGASVEQIGNLFAGSQLAQALAVLAAPAVLKRFGLVEGTSGMQAVAAVCLGLLAYGGSVFTAALIYAAYMSAQVMAEPGLFTTLMNQVTPAQRLGASSLNFLVMFGCQAAAAAIGGWTAGAYGYRALLAAAAATAALSAILFRVLLAPAVREQAPAARAAEHAG